MDLPSKLRTGLYLSQDLQQSWYLSQFSIDNPHRSRPCISLAGGSLGQILVPVYISGLEIRVSSWISERYNLCHLTHLNSLPVPF